MLFLLRDLYDSICKFLHHRFFIFLLFFHLFCFFQPFFEQIFFSHLRICNNTFWNLNLFSWTCSKYFCFFKKCPHRSFKIHFCIKIKHDSHSFDFWIDLNFFDFYLIKKTIEKWCLVNICVENQFIWCSSKEFFALISCA